MSDQDIPLPFVPAEVDLRGLSGFMLDVDRLLASELIALGTPEECWAALMLWCRAWKQSPPASLPDDDRVLAAFSGAGKRWPKVKAVALRGFIKCSDGRLYHLVLAAEAMKAWKRRETYRADQERLKRWREAKKNDTGNGQETPVETRFKTGTPPVSEPERQGQGQGQKKESVPTGTAVFDEKTIELAFWKTGKAALGTLGIPADKAGALLGKWKSAGRDVVIQAINRALDRDCDADALVAYVEASLGGKRLNGARSPPQRKPLGPAAGTPEWHAMRRQAGAE